MNVVGFDTSTAATSACVLRADGQAFEEEPAFERLFQAPAHGRELLPALDRLLARAGLGWPDVDVVAVGVGPGRFTGLRVGVATARGLAASTGVELRPVSSLRALAAGIEAPAPVAVIDARRDELYCAAYRGGTEVVEPFLAPVADAVARLAEAVPDGVAAGDGSVGSRQALEAAGVRVEPDGSRSHAVRASHVCRLAYEAPAATPQAVLPDYRRSPDAKPRIQ